jgi:hypothetical protein
VIACLLIVLVMLVQVLLAQHMQSRVALRHSPAFIVVSLIGVQLVFASVIPLALDPSVSRCTVHVWLLNLGCAITLGALFSKVYRLHRVLNNPMLQLVRVTQSQLALCLALFVVADGLVLAVWSGADSYSVLEDTQRRCSSDSNDAFVGVLIATKGVTLLVLAAFAHRIRLIPSTLHGNIR